MFNRQAESKVASLSEFVANNGHYFYGSTFARYSPKEVTPSSLPASALLDLSLTEGSHGEMVELLCHIQRGTAVNTNAWSVKNSAGQLSWEIYHPIFPPTQARLHGREVVALRHDALHGRLAPFIDLHAEFFRKPRGSWSEPAVDGPLFVLSFEAGPELWDTDEIAEYTVYVLQNVEAVPLQFPLQYEGLRWRPSDGSLSLAQRGITLEPFTHERAMRSFLDAILDELNVPETAAEDCILPWLVEDTGRYRIGASRKIETGGFAVYYCGIKFGTFTRFLEEFEYPHHLLSGVRERARDLEHLVVDVLIGYDVVNGRLRPVRSSFYGMF